MLGETPLKGEVSESNLYVSVGSAGSGMLLRAESTCFCAYISKGP